MADHNPFRWVEIYVQDMARARKFYETVCKLKLEKLPSPEAELWAFPMAPNAAGGRQDPPQQVLDRRARLYRAGPRHRGNMFGLHSMK